MASLLRMVDVADNNGERIETRSDLGDDDAALFQYWLAQEAIAEREEKDWVKQARKIVERYRDKRGEAQSGTHRLNLFWSNVQTLLPTLYARTPKADVQRRFADDDPVGRLASTLMERCLNYSLDAQDFDGVMESVVEDRLLPGRGVARVLYVPHFGDEIREPQIESDEGTGEQQDQFEDEDAADAVIANPGDEGGDKDGEAPREVVFEEAIFDYVYWEDYREGPARKGREVPWVRFQSYLNRDQLVKRFGEKKGKQVNLDYTPKGAPDPTTNDKDARPPADLYKKARVYEFWDRDRLEVVWLAPGTDDIILDKVADPLRLPDFFPRPEPLFATTTNDKRVPVPDYIQYQDQCREIDRLTARIDKLTRALKVAGVYAGDNKSELQQLLDEGTENRLIPVGDSLAWADKGGMKGIIEWLPIQQIAETLIQLQNQRDKVKALLYEITGIGDILRGMTDPDENAAAQKLKSNFATRRITPQQKKVAKFAKGALRLMAAIVCEHFSDKTISLITGYPQLQPVPQLPQQPQPPQQALPAPAPAAAPAGLNANGGGAQAVPGAAPQGPPQPPSPQMQAFQAQMAQWQQAQAQVQKIQADNAQKQQAFAQAVELIKRDGVHGFRIDIEADSTIAIDEAEDQENRVEFMQQFIPLMEQVVPLAQGNPALAALAKEVTLFGMRGFKVARALEETVTKAFDAIAGMPPPQKDAQGGQDSPADLAVRSKQVDAQNAKTQVQLQLGQQKNALEAAKLGQQAHDSAAKLAADEAKARADHTLAISKAQDEAAFRKTRAASIESREASRLT